MVIPAQASAGVFGPRARRLWGGRFSALALVTLLVGPSAARANLEAVSGMLASGAYHVALARLDEIRPPVGSARWPVWHRLQVRTLAGLERWDAVVKSAEELPAAVPQGHRRWAQVRVAQARLARGEPAAARRQAARVAAAGNSDVLRAALRVVYRAYRAEARAEDALTAVDRFRHGAGATGRHAVEQADILAGGGRTAAALAVLEGADEPAARLRLLELLLAEGRVEEAERGARRWLEAKELPEDVRGRIWGLLARIAGNRGEESLRIQALERSLTHTAMEGETAGQLWAAYAERGRRLGNRAGLLLGSDGAWLAEARSAEGVDRRALLAVAARQSRAADARRRARKNLVDSLAAAKRGGAAVRLFDDGEALQESAKLAPGLRQRLGDLAIQAERYPAALRWWQGVEPLPTGDAGRRFLLHRARLQVRLGYFERGAGDLLAILREPAWLGDAPFRDRFLQVVFDLQEADQHATAYLLFKRVMQRVGQPEVDREMLFWMAETREAEGSHQAAADLYLRSAVHPAGRISDPWARTARFRAARALEETDYLGDALAIYQGLLGGGDPRQRMAIRQRINRLQDRVEAR